MTSAQVRQQALEGCGMGTKTHTPKPWKNRYFNRDGSIDIDAGAHKLARVYVRLRPDGTCGTAEVEEAEANANLIEASPDLIDICRELLEALTNLGARRCFNGMDEDDNGDCPCTACKARRVIAKATGQ